MNNNKYCISHPKTLLVTALATALASAAQAQATMLEEVVVTAQKREQSLQETPIAITAFGEHEIEQRRIQDVTDLGTIVPNVKIAAMPTNTGKAAIAIRGSVTSNPAITWEPTVGIYVDNVYSGKISGNIFRVTELERIEVLRGPQGTLYGKNTIGGAVNLITTKPSGEFGVIARGGVGNFDYTDGYLSVNLPALPVGGLGDLKMKLSYGAEQRDGLYDNVAPPAGSSISSPFVPGARVAANPRAPNDTFNELDRWSARADLLWDVSESLSVRYTYDKNDADNTSSKEQLTHVDPNNLNLGVPIPEDLSSFIVDESKNASKISADFPSLEAFDAESHTLAMNYEVGEMGKLGSVSLRYIGNRREMNFVQNDDNDGTPFALFHSEIDERYQQTSHELQILGTSERFNYVLGVFAFDEEADVVNPLIPLNSFFGPLVLNNQYGLEAEQLAFYGQADYRPPMLQDKLTVTGGVRWSREEKDSYIVHPGDFEAVADEEWTNVAPTFILAYDFTDELQAYAKYSKGWKAGGFNGEAESVEGFVDGYDPEEVDAWEVGFKSRLMDNRLQLNAAAFYNDETDLQVSVFTSGSSASTSIRNAGEAVKKGVELEVTFQPTSDLLLSANIGFLDSEFKEFNEFDPVLGMEVNRKNERSVQYAPDYNFNLSGEYTFMRASWGHLNGRLDYTYSDDYVPYLTPEQNATSMIDGYGVLNGRLSLLDIPVGNDNVLSVALWGKNLTDEDYRLNTIPFGPWTVSFFGDPRTYGLEAVLRFQ